jgi:hypothetical protein
MEVADAWRAPGALSPAEIALCERVARPAMESHGYAPAGVEPSPVSVAGWYASAPVKLGLAAATNLRTVRNPVAAVRRRLAR